MHTLRASTDLEVRATEALQALLGRVSGVRLKEIKRRPKSVARGFDFIAHVEVFGHPHALACKVKALTAPRYLHTALEDLCSSASQFSVEAKPVLIAPCLGYEAEAMCNRNRAGFLDFEGNARLDLGDVFIGMRSHPCRASERPSVPAVPAPSRVIHPANFRHVPPHSSHVALIA